MKLLILFLLPLASSLLCYPAERICRGGARWVALLASLAMIGITLNLSWPHGVNATAPSHLFSFPWLPAYGIALTLALDGLSLIFVWLTSLLTLIAVLASWRQITEKVGGYYFCLLWIIAGILGVFLARDLFLFYFCWEMMLVPMYFLIGIWGHENRVYAAIKFFLFTFISGLLLFAAILGLYWLHGSATGSFTFDLAELIKTPLTVHQQYWLAAGFFLAFAVKLPIVGLHTWLPDAHTEAPTAGSIILAGLLLKTGGYGLIRFVMPLFPAATAAGALIAALIGLIAIFYGGVLAFAQSDLKKLIAYSSVSHMGFVLLGLATGTPTAGQGAVMQMVCHGLSTGALFALVGMIDERFHTRNLASLGGLWTPLPRLAGFTLFFALASLGLPGLGNFIAELLVLVGTFQVWKGIGVAGAIGLIVAAIYSLKIVQRTVHGPLLQKSHPLDLSGREWSLLAPLAILLIGLGLSPGPVLTMTEKVWEQLPFRTSMIEPAEPTPGN